jgi:single-strand DNA-binding protein
MANVNRVVVSGNLTRDPELRQLAGGNSVCKLRIAVNTRKKDKDSNQWSDVPNYFDVTVWGAQGENVAKYCQKGSGLLIDGRLEWREWQAQDGQNRQAVEIIAENTQFLGGREGGGGGQAYSGGGGGGSEFAPGPDRGLQSVPAADDDDIPF